MATRTWEDREQRLLEVVANAENEGREARVSPLGPTTSAGPPDEQGHDESKRESHRIGTDDGATAEDGPSAD